MASARTSERRWSSVSVDARTDADADADPRAEWTGDFGPGLASLPFSQPSADPRAEGTGDCLAGPADERLDDGVGLAVAQRTSRPTGSTGRPTGTRANPTTLAGWSP